MALPSHRQEASHARFRGELLKSLSLHEVVAAQLLRTSAGRGLSPRRIGLRELGELLQVAAQRRCRLADG